MSASSAVQRFMIYQILILFPVTFLYLCVLWVIALVVYNLLFEAFDFGPLGSFIGKSALLLAIIAAISVIPYGHWFTLIVWWIGLMVIFKKDFWECKILVLLIWGLSIVSDILIRAIFAGITAD